MSTHTHQDRSLIYRRLEARNRLVGVLRIAVPLSGLLILGVLLVQIYLSGMGDSFSIGRVEVTPDNISVEAPEYAGILSNGTTYRVSAATARAAPGAAHLITLADAGLTMTKPDGVQIHVHADQAVLDTSAEAVVIKDLAYVEDSTGTSGIIADSVFDYAAQTLVGQGAVSLQYADGTTLDGEGLVYDLRQAVWTFTEADVTLPRTPGSAP
ncbi:hypothetical protein [Devosia submarina]|uniref:hypothetical protein n=1 Tax=Devosia submarina TaxID=1173082 RepID=UPI000D33373A|nr:hypothetical protein [Devosia submarina]